GFHIDERTHGLIDRGQHSGGRLDRHALLKRVDESACERADVTRHVTRNHLRIPIEARQAATDTALRALKSAGNAADRDDAHEDTLANRSWGWWPTIGHCAADHMRAVRRGLHARHNVSAQPVPAIGLATAASAGLNRKSYLTV